MEGSGPGTKHMLFDSQKCCDAGKTAPADCEFPGAAPGECKFEDVAFLDDRTKEEVVGDKRTAFPADRLSQVHLCFCQMHKARLSDPSDFLMGSEDWPVGQM